MSRERLDRFQQAIKRETAGSLYLAVAVTLFLAVLGYKMSLFYSNVAVALTWVSLVLWFWCRLLDRGGPWWRKVASFAVISGLTLYLWLWTVPLQSREDVAVKFENLWKSRSFGEFHKLLSDLETNPEYRDIWLLNKGRYAFTDRTGQDPEQFLALVQPDSPYYEDAQWLRLRSYSEYRGANDKYRQELLASLERARYLTPVYYRVQLSDYGLSYDQIVSLYNDFKKNNGHIFDFDKMKIEITLLEGVPSSTSIRDFWAMPGMTALFALRLAEEADRESRYDKKCEAVQMFEAVAANADTAEGFLNSSFDRLYIKTMVRQLVDDLKSKSPECSGDTARKIR